MSKTSFTDFVNEAKERPIKPLKKPLGTIFDDTEKQYFKLAKIENDVFHDANQDDEHKKVMKIKQAFDRFLDEYSKILKTIK